MVGSIVTADLAQDVKDFDSVEDMEKFLLEHGKQVVNELGAEVDRIELKIKVSVASYI